MVSVLKRDSYRRLPANDLDWEIRRGRFSSRCCWFGEGREWRYIRAEFVVGFSLENRSELSGQAGEYLGI
jgi:hypothetical protein